MPEQPTVNPETIVVAGRQADIPMLLTQILALNQILQEKDLGQWVGQPVADAVKQMTLEPPHLTVFFSDKPDRMNPFGQRPQFKIPFIRRTITWEEIKIAAGGKNGYQWGRYFANATISDDNLNKRMRLHAATTAEAKDRLQALASLSKGKILSINTGEEEKIGERADGRPLKKETTRVYPIYFSIVNPQRVAKKLGVEAQQNAARTGRATLTGESYVFRSNKFWLYFDQPPSFYKDQMTELLKLTDED